MAHYTNKFIIQIVDVARLIFIDERMTIKDVPPTQTTVADLAMSVDNLKELKNAIEEILKKAGV